MKIIVVIQILIKLFTIGYGAGAVRTTGRFTAPAAAGKRADTCGFYPLNSRFPLFPNPAQTRDRRPLRKGERQSGYRFVSFVKYSQFTDTLLLHMRVTLRRARHTRVAQLVYLDITDGTCELHLSMLFIRTYGGRKRIAKRKNGE